MNNHWQLNTTPVLKKEDDKLSHDSIAELLEEKIDYLFLQDDIPSCICLNGEYGSGKSTIINLLFKKWEGATNKKVVHFNIWRHKDENTYYALFRNIFYALRNKDKIDFRKKDFLESLTETEEILSLDNDFTRLVYASFSRKEVDKKELTKGIDDFVTNLPRYLGKLTLGLIKVVLIGSLLISIVGLLIDWAIYQDFLQSIKFAAKLFLLFSTSTTILSFLFKNIFKNVPSLFKLHIQPAESNITLPNISNTEQLQCIFRNMLHKYCNNGENKKLVIVIEDVDRKHNDEIIKTLNELRTFIDLGKAIFIIPCDLNNIERAFYDSAIDKSSDLDEKYIKWKAKDFSTKIFSHIITIPAQNQQDLRDFLMNKINVESSDHPVKRYLNEGEKLESLIDILLVASIKTPREAINIFNRFTLQFEHALKLEQNQLRLKKGTVSKNILKYARVFILSVYYGLEKELLGYPELPTWILNIFRSKDYAYETKKGTDYSWFNIIPKYAKERVCAMYINNAITPEIEEFVSRTEIYDSELIKPFIYLDEISYSGKVGNEIHNIILSALKSRNLSKLTKLINDSNIEISEVILRITDNLRYDSDFQTIIPSIIDVFVLIDKAYKLKVANFILEHFHRIPDKALYKYEPGSIIDIFNIGNRLHSEKAKRRYFDILNKDKDSITEYCTATKVFDIVLSLINSLSENANYVDISTRNLINDFVSVPVSDELEFEQRIKYLELIDSLEESVIEKLFSTKLLKRLLSNINDFYNNCDPELLKRSINKLISIYINKDRVEIINQINELNGHVNHHLDNWFIDLIVEHQELIKEQSTISVVLESIHKNILKEYFTEEGYKEHEQLIEKTLKVFSKLDGYNFKTLKHKSKKGFSGLLSQYKECIQSDSSNEFYSFMLESINIHENDAGYTLNGLLTDSFIEYLRANLWISDNDSSEFANCMSIAKFLVQNNRITNLKEEQQNLFRDMLFTQLKTFISQNVSNTEKSESIFEFIKELNYAPKFNDILTNWVVDTNLSIASNGTPLSHYRDYLQILDLIISKLQENYLTQFLNVCLYLVRNYKGNENYTDLAWEWIRKISETEKEIPLYKDQILPEFFTNYPNKTSYYIGDMKQDITKMLYQFSPYEVPNDQNMYNEMLLWSSEEFSELIDMYDSELSYFDKTQKYKALQIIDTNSKWSVINKTLDENPEEFTEFVKDVILLHNDVSLVEKLYANTKTKLNWSTIITNCFLTLAVDNKVDEANSINSMPTALLNMFDKTMVNGEVYTYLMNLLKDNINNKFIALELIDKLKITVSSKSDLFYTVKSEFVDICDMNTDVTNLKRLKDWLKKHKLTPKSGIDSKLREIMQVADVDLKPQLESLIKY